jgi:hypothetical protein
VATRCRFFERQYQGLHQVIADVPGNRVAGGRLGRQRLPPHGQALWIAQQLIGRVHPLEFAAGDRRRVAIRVPEHGQPPVGALDFLARRLLLYAKDGERIVSEGHRTVTGRRTAALLRISRILPILQCYPYTQLATKSSRQSSDPHASTCKTMTILTFVMPFAQPAAIPPLHQPVLLSNVFTAFSAVAGSPQLPAS